MIYDDRLDDAALRRYASALNARARSARVQGEVSADDLRDCILESGGRCEWCGSNLLRRDFEIDHIINLTRGGINAPENLAVSCPDCNRRKADRHPATFAQETAARTGQVNALIRRVLDHYQMPPAFQRGLFDDPPPAAPTAAPDPDPTDDDPPPYRW